MVDATGGWDLQEGSGSGAESGATYWSYAGSGDYTDASGASGIVFLTPGGEATTVSGGVTGTASATGQSSTTDSGSWTSAEDDIGFWTYAGRGTTTSSDSSTPSYSGSGDFAATGAVEGVGTITESGYLSTSDGGVSYYVVDATGGWDLQGGSGSGTEGGATSWSYSGIGSYSDDGDPIPITFLTPNGSVTTSSGTLTGTASASGKITSADNGNWTSTEDDGGNWTYSGGGTTTTGDSSNPSYSGSCSFTAPGGVTGGGTVTESGNLNTTDTGVSNYNVDSTGGWVLQGRTGNGTESGSTLWSYGGSGSYTDSTTGTSTISFFVPGSGSATISGGSVTGRASASGEVTLEDDGSWTSTEDGSGNWTYPSGSGSTTTEATADGSYSGSGSFTASSAVTGSGTISESGSLETSVSSVNYYDVEPATGVWNLLSGSGSGDESASMSWSYSGSGSYTDNTTGTSGIAFFVPGSGSATVSGGSVTGRASTSGEVTLEDDGSWTSTEDASGNWSYSGSGSTTTEATGDGSYSGSGSFTASSAVTGSGTITESGSQDATVSSVSYYDVEASSGDWNLLSGSGSGDESTSTSWSYSGSGSYTDSTTGTSAISFFVPGSGSATISGGSVTGRASASGEVMLEDDGDWTSTEDGSGNWTYPSGSGSTTIDESNDASYSGSGSFTASSAVTGSGTISESGSLETSVSSVSYYDVEASSGDWNLLSGSGSGDESISTSWSYSGSGSYTDNTTGTSGIAFFVPGSGSATVSGGSVTGRASTSGEVTLEDDGSWTSTEDGSGNWTYPSGSGSTTTEATADGSYSGSGSFTASSAVTGSGTISESGSLETSVSSVNYYDVEPATGVWNLLSGSGSGEESGATSWSYSGSGSYTDAAAASEIAAFPSPVSGTPINSGPIVGTAQASGGSTTTTEENWSATENSAGNWNYSDSASTSDVDSATTSYSGSGSFTQSITDDNGGNMSASGTVSECGHSQSTATYYKTFQMGSSGTWVEQNGTGSSDVDWSTGWSYAGTGTYSYPDPAGSGTITGMTSASGGNPIDPDESGSTNGSKAPAPPTNGGISPQTDSSRLSAAIPPRGMTRRDIDPEALAKELKQAHAAQAKLDAPHKQQIYIQWVTACPLKTVAFIRGGSEGETDKWARYVRRYWPGTDTYKNVRDLKALADALKKYPNGSISLLIIGAHGDEGEDKGTMPFHPIDLQAYPDLAKLIASKLSENAIVDIQACRVATTWGDRGMQVVANLLQATIIANTHYVHSDGLQSVPILPKVAARLNIAAFGKWISFKPSIKNAAIQKLRNEW